jgi:hypothetical protein
MNDEQDSAASKGTSSSKPESKTGLTRAQARARVLAATGSVGPDLTAAAERAVAELRLGFANRGAQIGFLDDIVDFVHDVVDVTERLLEHLVTDDRIVIPVITGNGLPPDWAIEAGIGLQPGKEIGPVTDPEKGASARELLKTRQAILDATAQQSRALQAMAASLRAQAAAMRRPKTPKD